MEIATRYEDRIENATLGKWRYSETKPPGHLLFYMATERVSRLFPELGNGDPLSRLLTFCVLIYPLLTYLVLIPLFGLARLWLPPREALLVCLLYALLPNVTLVDLFLDQVLYPGLFIGGLFLFVAACRSGSPRLAFASGVAVDLSLFFSFSVIGLLPLMLVHWLGRLLALRRDPAARSALAGVAMWSAFGFLVAYGVLALALDYDMILRYRRAMSFHTTWKIVYHSPQTIVYSSIVNYIEYATWVGLPVAIIWLSDAFDSLARLIRRSLDPIDILSAGVLGLLILLGLYGRTISEVGRLWLYLAPLLCIAVIRALRDRFPSGLVPAFTFLAAMEFVTTLLLKRFQDFLN